MRKFLLFLITVSLMVFLSSEKTLAFAKGEQDCSKCHKLSSEEAKKILNEVIPNIKILNVQDGPINGLWEIGFEANGKKGIVYIDYSTNNLIAGNIIAIKTKKNFTQESFLKISPPLPPVKLDLSQIPLKNALVMGEKTATNKVVVFDDPD